MSMLGTIVMVGAGIGAVIGMRQSKGGAAWGRPVAIGCALLTVGLAAANISSLWGSGAKGAVEAANKFNFASGDVLGRHLGTTFKGSRVLLLVPPTPTYEASVSFHDSMIDGLKAGMGTNLELVHTVALEPPEEFVSKMKAMGQGSSADDGGEAESFLDYEMMNYEVWFEVSSLDSILEKYKGTYDLLVSAVGLPIDFPGSALAGSSDLPEIAVLNAPPFGIIELVKSGVLDAVVAFKPVQGAWKNGQKVPNDSAAAFDQRYVLLTTDNIAEVSASYPNQFE